MFLFNSDTGGQIYKVVKELPDGLSFLCRRVRIDTHGQCANNTMINSLKMIRAVPEEGDQCYFENISLYETWEDLLRDCGECEL